MGYPGVLLIMIVLAVIAQIPAVRKSRTGSTVLMVASVGLFTALFALPPNDISITWPLIVAVWSGVVWKIAVDAAWTRYSQVRSESPRYNTELPASERVLMLAYNVVPLPVGTVLSPVFVWLFVRDLAAISSRAGFALDASFERLPAVATATSFLFLVLMVALVFAFRRKNLWLTTQLRIARAAMSVGEARERWIRAALDAEPPLDSATHLTSASS